MSEVDKNFEWFKKNKKRIIEEHKISKNDYIVISNQKFIKKFKNYEEAFTYSEINLKKDGYIIQKISDLDSDLNCFGYMGLVFNYAKNH